MTAGTVKQRAGRILFRHLPITRFLFDQLRVEANAIACSCLNTILPHRRRRLHDLRKLRAVRVNVACGPHVADGFVNIDLFAADPRVIPWDCRRSLPLADASAAGIRVEHFVEHLETREDLPAFLADCHRVLAPDGVLRVIVPDAGRYLEAYVSGGTAAFEQLGVSVPFPADLPTRMDVVNHVFHQWEEHRWGYDFETLAHRLTAAGFSTILHASFRSSRDPLLADDRAVHEPYSLYVEAVK